MKWKGLSDYENSWEIFTTLQRLFPHPHLEDKMPLDGQGNVRTHIYIFCGKKQRDKSSSMTSGSQKSEQMANSQMTGP